MDILDPHWLRICPSSRAETTRRYIAIFNAIRTVLHFAGSTLTLEPKLLDPRPTQDRPGHSERIN